MFTKDYNLFVREIATGEVTQLTEDGVKYADYATPTASGRQMKNQGTMDVVQRPDIRWSPDSKKFATYYCDARSVGELHLIQSVNNKSIRPLLYTFKYQLPGDTNMSYAIPYIFDVEKKTKVKVDSEPYPVLWFDVYPTYRWFQDSHGIYFTQQNRSYSTGQLVVANAETGRSKVLINEETDTFFDRGIIEGIPINNGEKFLWASERDGWKHYYMYDGKTGKQLYQLTKGNWVNREIISIDEKKKVIYFMAGGKEKDRNPYYKHFYKVNFDGTKLTLLTPENAYHIVRMSPNKKYFVDTYSRVDLPPVTVVRSCKTGKKIRDVEQADITELLATGWKNPEPFTTIARDGRSKVYGIMYKPTNFDPNKKYPVIDNVYTGPGGSNASHTFGAYSDQSQAIAELGFLVIQMDGMGTGRRARAFRKNAHKNLTDGGFEDHVLGIQQLAKKHAYIDDQRVGIYGFSAGGYDALNAMLRYPDFYKVGVSASGNHDHRMDKADWNEMWMSYPVEDHYIEQSNITRAHQLQGKLLLGFSDMDHNVNPYCSMRLIDALIKANKDFDLVIIPNGSHYLSYSPYWVRKRWDHFVKHLLGVNPPLEYKIGGE